MQILRPALLVALAALVLAGCPRRADEAPQGAASEAPEARDLGRFEGVKLRYHGDGVGQGPAIERALLARFEAATGAAVDYRPGPRTREALEAYQRGFAAKDPGADVILIDVIWPGSLAPHLRDLKPALAAQAEGMFPELVRNDTIDGRLVAMPLFTDAGLLFYRQDLLAKLGEAAPPATWGELEDLAARLQAVERPRDPAFAGFVFQADTYEGLTCNALEWQHSHGGGGIYAEDTGAVSLDNPRAARALTRAAGWVGTIAPLAVLGWQEEDARKHFAAGHAAFMRNWPYAWATLAAPGSPVAGKVGVAPLPQGDRADTRAASVLGGWHLAVSAYSREPEAATALVRWLTSTEVQRWRARVGSYLPAARAAYEDEALKRENPVFKIMPQVLEQIVVRPSSRAGARYPGVSAAYQRRVAKILRGASAERELSALAAELRKGE